MNFTQVTSLIIMGLSVAACGGGGGSSSPNSKSSTGTGSPAPKTTTTSVTNTISNMTVPALVGQSADIIPMSNNVAHVVHGLMFVQSAQRGQAIPDNAWLNLDLSTDLDLAYGGDISLVDIMMPKPTVIQQGAIARCYSANNLTVKQEGRKLYIDGVISEYETVTNRLAGNKVVSSCSGNKLSEFTFTNSVMNEALLVEAIDSVSYEDLSKSGQVFLPTYQFTALVYEHNLRKSHGDAWAIMQNEYINDAAKELGNHLFKQSLNTIDIDISPLTSEALIDFNSLDKSQLLIGTIWGSPGAGIADKRWCKIVNFPDNSHVDTIKYQTVIAVNCARSTKRWCDTKHNINASDAAAPVAWSDSAAKSAKTTADAEKLNSKVTKAQSNLSNVSPVRSYSAITPLFGDGYPQTNTVFNQTNNAGSGSQTGRVTSCQDIMDPSHTEIGIGYSSTPVLGSAKYSIQDFWTHELR
ncbi:hypothetical protein [Vibrio splendidus]|uniref:Uncharacterized protein n=1 Tax=Vibrio splendidus TaxID=29497 RepID=A0A2N7JRL3_VIBSP|nr:hypothetical protein [Vibrio splendidus]PMM56105.1 hypothetical protein BCT54_22100 [Vibrio splendidus]